jgi:hypothetical protein
MTAPHSPARVIEDLEDATRYRLNQARLEQAASSGALGIGPYLVARGLLDSGSPALDCADLRATFQRSKAEAAAALANLTRPQLVLQAWCYAAYLSEARGEDISAEYVLTNWEEGLPDHGHAVAHDA